MFKQRLPRGLLAAGVLLMCSTVSAAGLQVAPIGLTFKPSSPAQGLWLTNTGSAELSAQVRVFQWTQNEGKDNLAATQILVASPPMLKIAPGARQLVRVMRIGAASSDRNEGAFRVLVDELPVAQQAEQTGVSYVMRHSVPVFVQPSAIVPDASAVAATLHWSLVREGDGIALQARNAGTTHAQVSAASLLLPSNTSVEISPGLLGYVLPDMTMRWALKVPAAQLGTGIQLKARINGKALDQNFSVGDLPR